MCTDDQSLCITPIISGLNNHAHSWYIKWDSSAEINVGVYKYMDDWTERYEASTAFERYQPQSHLYASGKFYFFSSSTKSA